MAVVVWVMSAKAAPELITSRNAAASNLIEACM
jgi:hypothetical protein